MTAPTNPSSDQVPSPAQLGLSPLWQQLQSRTLTKLIDVGGGWLLVHGWFADKKDADSYAAMLAGVLILILGNVATFLWSQRYRLRLLYAPVTSAPTYQPLGTPTIVGGGTTLRQWMLPMLLALSLLVAGCSSNPTVQLADTTRAVTLAATSIQAADQAGYIKSPATRRKLDVLLLTITDYVNRANALNAEATTQPALARTSGDVIRGYVDAANAELPRLLQLLADETKASK